MERTLIKIAGKDFGPYILTYVGDLVIPVSLRGPHTNEDWFSDSEEGVIDLFKAYYGDDVVVSKITTELADLGKNL